MTLWRIVFPRGLHDGLARLLAATHPRENGCYVTAAWHESAPSHLLARSIIPPDAESWNEQGEHRLDASSAYLNRAIMGAESAGACLLFVHTHPLPQHSPRFSRADELANERFFDDVSPMLDGRPLGSMVMSGAGMTDAAIRHEGKDHVPASIDVVGRTLERRYLRPPPPAAAPRSRAHERQEALLGPETQARLGDLAVSVAGVGGVGSAVAVQLARLGAGRIILVDHDRLEESNVSRLHGSRPGDVGRSKAEIVAEHLGTFSDADVRAVRGDVRDPRNLWTVTRSDVVMCCTDNLRSRDYLNEAALVYYKPLVDAGCHVTAEGGLEATICAQLVSPDTPCLWCTGQIDPRRLGHEFLPEGQREEKRALGYYEPRQPAVVTFTTWAACLAVDKLLSLLGPRGKGGGGRESVSYVDIANEFSQHRTPPIKEGCICGRLRFGGGSDAPARGGRQVRAAGALAPSRGRDGVALPRE